ncbi:MAG: hypothetical protein A2073_08575 [Deltaproteobacteria bacterium GWC2_42_11]|nr:MAG: hypothetical protein A2073_08575 [Deltaproteobacteria bacterium GWC2_42_11]HBO83486.1 hypothetical protein [Deltaproteobacteria bacterium]
MKKITKDTMINDAIKLYPKTIAVFNNFKIDSCCGGAVSIEDAAKRDKADIDALLDALNRAAEG